jgi:outer membrane protein
VRGAWLCAVALMAPVAVSGQGAPLTLDRAIEVALTQSRDVEDAQLTLRTARQQVREAWGTVYPQLDLSAMYTRNLTVPGTFLPRIFVDPDAGPDELVQVRFGSDNTWSFQLRAEQPLFQASAFIGVGAASRYEALQSEVLRGRSQAVVTRVRLAYYDALLAQEAVRLTDNTVRRIRQTLDEMRKMERAGVASNYEVLRLEVELANVEPALRRAQNGARAARRALAVELGLPELDGVELDGSLAALEVDALDAAESVAGDWRFAVEAAKQQRTELRQLELTESLRHAEMRAEQSEYLPRISLFGTYSINAQQSGGPVFFGSTGAERAYGRQVGVQVTMPLFNGFKRPARVAQRRYAVEQIRTQRELVEDQVENQVRTVVEQLEEARERARAQRLGVSQAQRGFQIATVQFREGLGSALELTDAEVALRQSEFNYAEAVYDYLVARARLEDAMGNVDIGRHVETGVNPEVER